MIDSESATRVPRVPTPGIGDSAVIGSARVPAPPDAGGIPRSGPGVLALLLTIGLSLGCSSSAEFLEVQNRLDLLQRQLVTIQQQSSDRGQIEQLEITLAETRQQLARSRADAEADLRQLLGRLEALLTAVEQNTVSIGDLSDEVEASRRALEELQARVDRPAPVSNGPVEPLEPSELYQRAYQDYNAGEYTAALVRFRSYLESNPASDSADNAQYWIGECHFNLGEYREAIRAFNSVRQRYPASEKVPSALLRMGLAHLRLGERESATTLLRTVVSDYPLSDEAVLAERQLRSLSS